MKRPRPDSKHEHSSSALRAAEGADARSHAILPSSVVLRCIRLFWGVSHLVHQGPLRAVPPVSVAALQAMIEGIVLWGGLVIKKPRFGRRLFETAFLQWLRPASDYVTFVPFSPSILTEGECEEIGSGFTNHGNRILEQRADELRPQEDEFDFAEMTVLLQAAGTAELRNRWPESLGFWWRMEHAGWRMDQHALKEAVGPRAVDEYLDLTTTKALADRTNTVLWSVLDSDSLHCMCLMGPSTSDVALEQVRQHIAQLREAALDGRNLPYQAIDADTLPNFRVNFHLSPVLLAVLREARDRDDLIPIAVQMRRDASALRKHLASLDTYQGEDLLRIVDWRHEVQSVCDAVGKALGLTGSSGSGSLASTIAKCAGGKATDLVEALSELEKLADRMPTGMRRHLLHPMYFLRRMAFLRDLAYNAVLAPEMDRKLLKLFGESRADPNAWLIEENGMVED